MAKSIPAYSWINGFREPGTGAPWLGRSNSISQADVQTKYGTNDFDPSINGHDPLVNDHDQSLGVNKEGSHYLVPPSCEILTSSVHNDLGLNVLRTWPTIYDGTNTPHDLPAWWQPKQDVDVLICGAGPSGLQVALSLLRQGVSFRIIDKSQTPLIAGRADGVQPRFLETLHSWGLASEVHEEGPLIERTAIYKDGKKVLFGRSHQSDSRYRGLHIITQGQIERIYIRDLLRHHMLVERQTVCESFECIDNEKEERPIIANLLNEKTGKKEVVRAKFLVGSDGASSLIRKSLGIPFDGVSTDIYWGIMDCQFETDYPHAWVFGSVISSKHGGCVIIPREDNYIRLYTQLDVSASGEIARSRQATSESFQESGGRVDATSITAEEVLAQANKIFDPYTLKFGSSLSWFAVWKISERVARSFSSPNSRVHLAGDAAHVHSVMGAFGLNASIMDSANLAWKIGLCARGFAKLDVLGPTYDLERRDHAKHIIRVSGSYLRFVCNSEFPLAEFVKESDVGTDENSRGPGAVEYIPGKDLDFVQRFFKTNGQFLLGVDAGYKTSPLSPDHALGARPIAPRNGVRAPNPRLCFSVSKTGYLYDALLGASMIHIVVFASDLQGPIKWHLEALAALVSDPRCWYKRFGGLQRFNIVVITTLGPQEADDLLATWPEFEPVRINCTLLYDDRSPDENAHTWYEVEHARGAIVTIRPDLWIGTSVFLENASSLEEYFGGFLLAPLTNGM